MLNKKLLQPTILSETLKRLDPKPQESDPEEYDNVHEETSFN